MASTIISENAGPFFFVLVFFPLLAFPFFYLQVFLLFCALAFLFFAFNDHYLTRSIYRELVAKIFGVFIREREREVRRTVSKLFWLIVNYSSSEE